MQVNNQCQHNCKNTGDHSNFWEVAKNKPVLKILLQSFTPFLVAQNGKFGNKLEKAIPVVNVFCLRAFSESSDLCNFAGCFSRQAVRRISFSQGETVMKNNKQTVYPKKHVFFVFVYCKYSRYIYVRNFFIKLHSDSIFSKKKKKTPTYCQCLNLTEILIF